MGNQILVNPYPAGVDETVRSQCISGSIVLYGSATTTGEPLNWTNMLTGIGYNEINFAGNNIHGQNAAYTTGFAVSSGVCTVTANNNFFAGQIVTFQGNTQTLSQAFNGVTVQILAATSTTFTFATATTGTTTTSDVGIAVTYSENFAPLTATPAPQNLTVTALSASGTTLTVTAANTLLPGAQVSINVATGTLGPKLAGLYLPVILSTGTAFTATMPSALSGTTGTGTGVGSNPPQPYSVDFWSQNDSGYNYAYKESTGVLFVQVGGGAVSSPMANIGAGAYPSGVLGDVIKFEAYFTKV